MADTTSTLLFQSPDEALFDALLALDTPDAAWQGQMSRRFFPSAQLIAAAHPDQWFVLGAAGAGKTALREVMLDAQDGLPDLFADPSTPRWRAVLAESSQVIDSVWRRLLPAQAQSEAALSDLWRANLLRALSPLVALDAAEQAALAPFFRAWEALPEAELAPARLAAESYLARVEASLAATDSGVVVLYDDLYRLPPETGPLSVAALVHFWARHGPTLNHIQPKLFLRETTASRALAGLPEASAMSARCTTLTWTRGEVFAAMARQISAASDEAAAWVRSLRAEDTGGAGAIRWRETPYGAVPLALSHDAQRALMVPLYGNVIVTDSLQIDCVTWIAEQLGGADGQVVPRALGELIGTSARRAREAPPDGEHIIGFDHLIQALFEVRLPKP